MLSRNRLNSIIHFLPILFILTSCSKSDEVNIDEFDYLIFGHFYGECIGEGCVETFMLTGTKLYEDKKDNYFFDNAEFDFVELGNDQFELVKDLKDYFPTALLDSEEEVFGCPDCGDWGGLFVQYAKDNVVKSWRIDQKKDDVPAYLHEFIDKINEKIALINN